MGRSSGTRRRQAQNSGGTNPSGDASPRLKKSERLAARRRDAQRRQRRNRVAGIVAVVLVLGAISAKVVAGRRHSQALEAALTSGSCRVDGRSDGDAGAGQNHVAAPKFSVDPPAGGDHTTQAASAGEFTASDLPPDGQIVHALEHGYVAIWYRPDILGSILDMLRQLANDFDRDVLLVPRQSLPGTVAATAWHHRLLCDSAEADSLRRFVTAYRNKGPERVPH